MPDLPNQRDQTHQGVRGPRLAPSLGQTHDGPMFALRGFDPLLAHSRTFGRLIVALLPLILAACSNGGGGGQGY